MFMECKTLEIS